MDQNRENEFQTPQFPLDNESIQTKENLLNRNNKFCLTKQFLLSQEYQSFKKNLSTCFGSNSISNKYFNEEKLNANKCQVNNLVFPEFDIHNNLKQTPYEELNKVIQLHKNDIQDLASTQIQQEREFSNFQISKGNQLQKSNNLMNHSKIDKVGLFMKIKSQLLKFGNRENEAILTEKIKAYLTDDQLDLELDVELNDQQKCELSATIRQHYQDELIFQIKLQLNIISPQQVLKGLLADSNIDQNEQKNKQPKHNPNSAFSNSLIEMENLLNRVKNQDHGMCYNKEDIVLMKHIIEDQIKFILTTLSTLESFEYFELSKVWEDVVNKRNIKPFIELKQNLGKKKQQNFEKAVTENRQLKIISQIAWIANGSVIFKEKGITEIPHYKILVIGKTGAGKSTFINMIVNLIQKLDYDDKRLIAIRQLVTFQNKEKQNISSHLECNLKVFKNRQSDHLDSVSNSQTEDCNMYTINTPFYKITFVDTPGLGDTKGTDSDKIHIQTIITKVQALSEINVILYIHRSSDCRADEYLKSYIDQLKGMLTKEYENNFIVCFTSVVNAFTIDALKVLEQIGIPLENRIYFENDCLTPLEMIQSQVEQKYLDIYKKMSQHFWDENQNQFEGMMEILSKLQPKKTSNLLDLLVKKESTIQILFEKQRQIELNENEKENLKQLKQEYEKVSNYLTQFRTEQSFFLPFVVYKQEKMKKKVTAKRILNEKVTFCHKCQNKCHDPCRLEGIYSKNSYNLKYCQAFKDSKLCKECNHSQDHHGHTFEVEEESETIEINQVPKIFHVEFAYKSNKQLFQEQLSKQREQINKQKEELENQIKEKEKEININFLLAWILNKEVQKVSFKTNQDITIEFFNEQIQKVNNDSQIDNQRKQKLIQRYYDGIEKYQQIKTRENYIQIGSFEQSQGKIEEEIKKILKTCSNRMMESIKNEFKKESQNSENSENLNKQGLMIPGCFCV